MRWIASSGGSGSARQASLEAFALEQLHRQPRLALVLADVEDGADVRMADRRRGARLAPEAQLRVVGLRRASA
jgi:hypothetical protein